MKIRIRRAIDNVEQDFDTKDPNYERQVVEFSQGGDCFIASPFYAQQEIIGEVQK